MRISNVLISLAAALLLCSCSGKEVLPQEARTTTYKVAVIMPQRIWATEKPIAQQALQNLEKAQERLGERVKLELEWIDEDIPNLEEEVRRVTHDTSYAAVVGPKYSRHARMVAKESLALRMPVIMPSVTSAEVQRIYSGSNKTNPNIFFMSENDMVQCQALLTVISRQLGITYIYVLSRRDDSDDYATTFNGYLPFLSMELKVGELYFYSYTDKESMREQIHIIQGYSDLGNLFSSIFFVPSSTEDMLWLDQILTEEEIKTPGVVDMEAVEAGAEAEVFPRIYCTEMACDSSLEGVLQNEYEGIALSGSPESGFPAVQKGLTGREIHSGSAQLYDSFTLLALALAHKEKAGLETVREAIVAVMDACDGSGNDLSWTAEGLADGFRSIRSGELPNMAGASGSWVFDRNTHISQLGTWYGHWRYFDGTFHFVEYLTRSDHAKKSSMDQLWNKEITYIGFSLSQVDKGVQYEPLQDRYAVVMATSTGWDNYRHQADALDIYRMLKNAGYPDDHIVLITEDDLAYNPENPHPGVVHVLPDGENLYPGVVNDYKISQLTPEDLGNILSGTVTERTPEVVHGSKNTNVLFFWSGHGLDDNLMAWADDSVTSGQIRSMLEGAQENYRKLLFVMEACYSGSVGEYCTGFPGLLTLTACSPGEKSHADVLEGPTYLSNAFTRVFREEIEKNPDISIYELYTELARHTTASHAMMYNYDWYGSVSNNTLAEYFKTEQQ